MRIGFSPCPNDTYIFAGLALGKLGIGEKVEAVLEDVETLNCWALAGELPVTKISAAVLPKLSSEYVALRAGGAMGFGVGPLLVAREPIRDLAGRRVAHPGEHTTGRALLAMYAPEATPVELRYDQIIAAVAAGEVEAGVLIHEGRFTYAASGLVMLADLGQFWEGLTGLPLPLGLIVARRELGQDRLLALESAIRESLSYSAEHLSEVWAYIQAHAQEMDPGVIRAHIDTYVNSFTADPGVAGQQAVAEFVARLHYPDSNPLFLAGG